MQARLNLICPGIEYRAGRLDLSACNFDTPKRVPLHRNWLFHWNELPEKATGKLADEGEALPLLHYWNYLDRTDRQPMGYATYTSTIVAPENGHRLGVIMPDIRSAYALYANNQLIASAGKVAKNEENYAPGFGVGTIALPQTDSIYLTLAVANFSHRYGGLHRAPHLGDYELLRASRQKSLLNDTLFQGFTLFIGLLNVLLFLYYREERSYLFFGLTALAVLLRQLSVDSILLLEFFPTLAWKTVQDLRYLGFYLGVLFGIWYYWSLFPGWIHRAWCWVTTGCCTLAALIVVLTPAYIGGWTSPVMQIVCGIVYAYGMIQLFRARRRSEPDAGISLAGMAVFLLFLVHDILVVNHILLTPLLLSFGFGCLVVTQAIVLSRRHGRAFRRIEELGTSLSVANQQLERTVADRTSELAIKNRRLEEVKGFKEQMLRMVVHDLKNPLGIVLGINRDRREPEHKRTYLAAQRMEKLVHNFLKLSEYETGRLNLQLAPCSLNDLLDHVERQLSDLRERHAVMLSREFADGATFLADESLIERVLLNLLANAIAYSPRGGTVSVRHFWREEEFYLEVEDRGRGIAIEHQEHIFQEFSKLEDRRESTGLGLAFCKVAIESHGGTLDLSSELGQGTTFFFTIPNALPRVKAKVERPTFQLSGPERAGISPHIPELLTTPMYRISRFQELVDKIGFTESEGVSAWKQAILTACYREDRELLTALLKDVTTESPDGPGRPTPSTTTS